jgi:hypothetical protein
VVGALTALFLIVVKTQAIAAIVFKPKKRIFWIASFDLTLSKKRSVQHNCSENQQISPQSRFCAVQ